MSGLQHLENLRGHLGAVNLWKMYSVSAKKAAHED
jgi:hypothetical protein